MIIQQEIYKVKRNLLEFCQSYIMQVEAVTILIGPLLLGTNDRIIVNRVSTIHIVRHLAAAEIRIPVVDGGVSIQ